VGAPVVGSHSGSVLGGGEVLQRSEAAGKCQLLFLYGGRCVFEALVQAFPTLGRALVLRLHALEHFVEHLGDDRVHGPPSTLEMSEVGVGERWLRDATTPRTGVSDTRYVSNRRRRRGAQGSYEVRQTLQVHMRLQILFVSSSRLYGSLF